MRMFKTIETRILCSLTFGKNVGGTFILFCKFQQHCNRTGEKSAYTFLWFIFCKSDIELAGIERSIVARLACPFVEEKVGGEALVEETVNEISNLEEHYLRDPKIDFNENRRIGSWRHG